MKTVSRSLSLIARLSIMAATLLLGQQALALGTDAGTLVSNQATVAYEVGGNLQTPIPSDPAGNSDPLAGSPTNFLVDRRVDFVLAVVDVAHVPVAPGEIDQVASFTLTNNGNAIMDFRLSVLDFGADVFGLSDTTDLANYRVRVGNGGGAPVLGDHPYVDELAEDATVQISVFADVPLTVLNGERANIELTATAADDATASATPDALDPDLSESPGLDDPTVIESVFADLGNNGFEFIQDGYVVISAQLVITKTSLVFSDPFGSDKAVPGAVIEYTVTIDNTAGASDATGVVITDVIQFADVDLQNGVYNGAVSNVNFNSGASFCDAEDAGDLNSDGCAYDITTGDLTIAVPDVPASTSMTVEYQVMISLL